MKTRIYVMMVVLVALLAGCANSSSLQSDSAPMVTSNATQAIDDGPAIKPWMARPAKDAQASKDMRNAAQLARDACAGRCVGTKIAPLLAANSSSPLIPPSWTVPQWYFDPANTIGCASNTNSGTSATCSGGCSGSTCPSGIGPLILVNEMVGHRWGTTNPQLQQSTILNILSGETTGQENIVLNPNMAAGAYVFGILGTNTLVTTLTPSTLTAQNRATPQLLQITVASATGLAAGQLAVDTTRGSTSTLSVVSGTTLTFAEPFTGTTIANATRGYNPTEDNGWSSTDSISFYTRPLLNLTTFSLQGATNSSSFAGGIAWIQDVQLPDPSGDLGYSVFAPTTSDGFIWVVDSKIDPNLSALGVYSDGFGQSIRGLNLYLSGFSIQNAKLYGGVDYSLASFIQGFSWLDGDIQFLQNLTVVGARCDFSNVYIASAKTITLEQGTAVDLRAGISSEFVWGAGSVNTLAGATFANSSGVSWNTCVPLTGSLELDGVSSSAGSYYTSGTWTSGVNVTAANIQSNGALTNPNSGSRYYTGN
jgi:hypothetical protein